MTKHLITAALPYANGAIHLGHLVEHVQTDVYTRFLRSIGEDVIFVCADDTHGTGIELNAKRQGISPEALVAASYTDHVKDFEGFNISFDIYTSTNTPENKALAERVYLSLKEAGHVVKKTSQQMYSESMGRFLPDRWVKGTCPYCKTPDQYGDQCESCKRTYEPAELIDPVDAIEGKTPIVKDTDQLYVKLEDFRELLPTWIKQGVPQASVKNFVGSWLDGDLNDWCISRDAPYFGFEIPGETGKFFYVWMDAPIGYIASTQHYCDKHGLDWMDYWGADADVKITHVIGKDIVYFHTLFWPAMLSAAKLKTPHRVQVHGFLTVNGTKMSKSRGTFVKASKYLEHLDPDYLRYYYAAKLSDAIDDIDLNLTDFVGRVNADLVNNVVNFCSRVTKFIDKRFDGQTLPALKATQEVDTALIARIHEDLRYVRLDFSQFQFARGMRRIAELGGAVNTYFQDAEPWKVIKEDPARAQEICTVGLYGAIALMTALTPVVPSLAGRFATAVGLASMPWSLTESFWVPATITAPKSLMVRMDPKVLEQIIEESKAENAPDLFEADDVTECDDFKPEITFDDFSKLDLRVGVIGAASLVKGADKLLQLTVHCGRELNVFAGIRSAYPDPSVLVGRRAGGVANLKPRKMRFGVSEGMLLATSAEDGSGLQLVMPDASAKGGWTVR